MVSDKNGPYLPNVDTSFRKTACDAVARINNVQCLVENQQIGRLRSMRPSVAGQLTSQA